MEIQSTRDYVMMTISKDQRCVYDATSCYLNVMSNVPNIWAIFLSERESVSGICSWCICVWFSEPIDFNDLGKAICGIRQQLATGSGLETFKSETMKFVGRSGWCYVADNDDCFDDLAKLYEVLPPPPQTPLAKIRHRLTPDLLKWIKNEVPQSLVTYAYSDKMSLDNLVAFFDAAGLSDHVAQILLERSLFQGQNPRGHPKRVLVIDALNRPIGEFGSLMKVITSAKVDREGGWIIILGKEQPTIKFGAHFNEIKKTVSFVHVDDKVDKLLPRVILKPNFHWINVD